MKFEEFYADHYKLACSIAKRFVNTNDVEDCAQEAMIRAWRYYDTLEDKRKIFYWAFSIFRNTAINMAKSQSIRPLSKTEELPDDLESNIEIDNWVDDVHKALSRSSQMVRDVTILKVEGYTQKEISEQLGISRKQYYEAFTEGKELLINSLLK